MTGEFFFHVLFFLYHIFKVRCYNAAYIFIFRCSFSHHSLIPSVLLLPASRYFADTVYPYVSYPSHIWSFVFPIKGEIYGVHSYFLYFKPPFGGLQMNEGVAVVSVRLSWDHLAHLIKHRSFNLVLSFQCTQKTTFTWSSTVQLTAGKHMHVHRQTWKHVFGQECSSLTFRSSSAVNFFLLTVVSVHKIPDLLF